MRLNSKELAFLAQQSSKQFDREGCLSMKQKTDKFFKKGDAFVERFFRLRGNLLFYFKGKDARSDPVGLLVLERCTVELDLNEQVDFSFLIVFEGEEPTYTFSARTEEDRDGWIQALHIASYECLKMQLQSLREQVQAKTGKDPLQNLPEDPYVPVQSGSVDDPAMEMSIAIEGLPSDVNGVAPNPFAVVYIIIPPEQQTWLQHNHTEMVEKNGSPHFLKTIGFGDATKLEPNTRVKIAVYHVTERMTGTMTQIGYVIFTLNNLLMAEEMTLSLTLSGTDSSKVGELTVVGWLNEATGPMVDLQGHTDDVFDQSARPRISTAHKRRSKRLDTLKPMCDNIITRTFRFETNEGIKLLVYEYLGESRFSFDIPIKLLKLFIDEENNRIKQLQDLGKMPRLLESYVAADINYRCATVMDYSDVINILACYRGPPSCQEIKKPCTNSNALEAELPGGWKTACQEYSDISLSCVTTYNQHIRYLYSYKGSNFKPSTKKGDKELEFVPVNLHLQRMTVLNEATETSGCYDIITVGAFTAYSRKYRAGGLARLLQQQQDQYTPEATLSKVSKVKRACQLINSLLRLQEEIIRLSDRVCKEALHGDGDSLQKATTELAERVKELVLECESPILQESANKLAEIHEEYAALEEEKLAKAKTSSLMVGDKSPEKSWKWTGSCFVKSPTVEPWDMTRVNTEAALVCLTSMVDDLIQNKSGAMDRPKWLGEISPAVIKLKSFVEIVCEKATHFMSFLDLMEHKEHLKFMHTVKCRRDVTFTHAITTLITGFVSHLNAHSGNASVMNQIQIIGVLFEMESLLTCHSDELGMIEDMMVAVADLASVTFKLVPETTQKNDIEFSTNEYKRSGHFPDLNRHHICVEVPVKKLVFDKLPQALQSGSQIKVVPLLFNVGINEQAFLAEKFGNTNVQEKINEESLGRLYKYIQDFQDLPVGTGRSKAGAGTLTELVQQLQYNVYNKKSKNVEILHLAAEICQKLNGIRVTCCKSAKDRTAMSVTLEQVQILQREHDLASHVFMQSLDCFRRMPERSKGKLVYTPLPGIPKRMWWSVKVVDCDNACEGVRRECVYKNIGQRKYAFNSLQLLSYPKQYRPPNGTYGNVQS